LIKIIFYLFSIKRSNSKVFFLHTTIVTYISYFVALDCWGEVENIHNDRDIRGLKYKYKITELVSMKDLMTNIISHLIFLLIGIFLADLGCHILCYNNFLTQKLALLFFRLGM